MADRFAGILDGTAELAAQVPDQSPKLTESVGLAYLGGEDVPRGSTHATATPFTIVMLRCLSAAGLYQRGLRHGVPGIALRLGFRFLLGALVMRRIFNLETAVGRGVRYAP